MRHDIAGLVRANELMPQLFAALSETLNNQVKVVTAEKKEMVDEAERTITLIRQMEMSLDDSKAQRNHEDDDLQVTFPLTQCLKVLKEKHMQIIQKQELAFKNGFRNISERRADNME